MSRPSPAFARIEDHFEALTDPRRRNVTYPLINVVVIAVCAVLCGADDFVAIAEPGKKKRDWLAKFLHLENGICSHDRFNAILAAIGPEEFEQCLLGWITTLHEITDGPVIAIDGKTLRRSFDKASGKAAIHVVRAWATANHISPGQTTVDEKSNEIPAIPKLLELLELSGSLVPLDAMGCQRAIAKQIVESEADYVLAVKGNQPTLHQGIVDFFAEQLEEDFVSTKVRRYDTGENGHGRHELRWYRICPVPKDLPDRARWPGLKALGITISNTQRDGRDCNDVRDYILSSYLAGKRFAEAVRSHWPTENNLHWQLDVTFAEDQSRLRQGRADANCSSLRRTALGLLKKESSLKVGIKNKRLTAAWDGEYLEKVLFG